MKTLDSETVAARLAELPAWYREGDEIVRRYEFDAYSHGALFAAGVALLADRMDHHPDLLLAYRKVEIRLSTHTPEGLTELDFRLAGQIETLFG